MPMPMHLAPDGPVKSSEWAAAAAPSHLAPAHPDHRWRPAPAWTEAV